MALAFLSDDSSLASCHPRKWPVLDTSRYCQHYWVYLFNTVAIREYNRQSHRGQCLFNIGGQFPLFLRRKTDARWKLSLRVYSQTRLLSSDYNILRHILRLRQTYILHCSVVKGTFLSIRYFRSKKKPRASFISQWLVGPLLRAKQQRRSYSVPSNDPTGYCEMKLAPYFFSFLKWRHRSSSMQETSRQSGERLVNAMYITNITNK